MYTIYGYGMGAKPFNKGVVMGYGVDLSYTNSIVEALATKYPGQWFGYGYEQKAHTIYSNPIRYTMEESK